MYRMPGIHKQDSIFCKSNWFICWATAWLGQHTNKRNNTCHRCVCATVQNKRTNVLDQLIANLSYYFHFRLRRLTRQTHTRTHARKRFIFQIHIAQCIRDCRRRLFGEVGGLGGFGGDLLESRLVCVCCVGVVVVLCNGIVNTTYC